MLLPEKMSYYSVRQTRAHNKEQKEKNLSQLINPNTSKANCAVGDKFKKFDSPFFKQVQI